MYTTYPNYDICKPLYGFYNRLIKRALFGLTLLHADFKQSIWAQIYEKGTDDHYKHNHHSVHDQLSWVHFIRVPNQKCFYFYQNNKKVYPDMQKEILQTIYKSLVRYL